MNHDTRPAPNSVSATVARPAGRRPRRPLLTYIILSAGLLTSIAALGAYRRAGMPATSSPVLAKPAPIAVAPPPASATPRLSATPAPIQVAAPAQKARPRVDLVFALDTTGSMGGLIDGAKRKIWSLASFVAQGQPTPDLRVGLVAYRDVGDAYVTRVYDLDADLDRVYKRLHALRAEGGGDTPEHVARALDEAVHKMSWSANAEAVKVIYLVGDAPPHTDYRDGYDYGRAARAAA
jgi:Mg-chelatase subunit ChlD